MFSMSLACVAGIFASYLNAMILHTFQDFEFAAFKPFLIKMFKVFFFAHFYSIWGFDSDWLGKQAFAPIFLF